MIGHQLICRGDNELVHMSIRINDPELICNDGTFE
ncbi:MAG: hypothetical protein ACJAXY_001296 [Nonlabens sp.]|jgi:hypothetical protein